MAKLYAATIKKSSPTTTYIPIDVAISGDKRSTLLVKSDQLNIIQEIQQCGERGLDSDKIVLWSKEGKAFSLDSRGTELLYSSEKQAAEEAHTIKKTKFLSGNVDTYVNVSPSKGSVEKLVKSSRVEDVTSGRKSFKELEKAGEGYSNITNLFFESKVLSRADDIAIRVREEFPLSSPEWQRWTNNTIKYNTTSLTQVVSEYFAGHSIGDVGGKLAGYVPKRGTTFLLQSILLL